MTNKNAESSGPIKRKISFEVEVDDGKVIMKPEIDLDQDGEPSAGGEIWFKPMELFSELT